MERKLFNVCLLSLFVCSLSQLEGYTGCWVDLLQTGIVGVVCMRVCVSVWICAPVDACLGGAWNMRTDWIVSATRAIVVPQCGCRVYAALVIVCNIVAGRDRGLIAFI